MKSLGDCMVCCSAIAKYKCPACETQSCSVNCSTQHKLSTECDGVRSKTKFQRISNMNDFTVLNDYRLIEDATSFVTSVKTNFKMNYTQIGTDMPHHMRKMKKACQYRRINIRFQPQIFERHEQNTSYYDWGAKNIYWRIKWIFPQADQEYNDDKVDEKMRVGKCVQKYFRDESYSNDLMWYHAAGMRGVTLLLHANGLRTNRKKYYSLDMSTSLRANLANTCILEYLHISVILNNHMQLYDVIDEESLENWICPKEDCNYSNFHERWSCRNCRTRKPNMDDADKKPVIEVKSEDETVDTKTETNTADQVKEGDTVEADSEVVESEDEVMEVATDDGIEVTKVVVSNSLVNYETSDSETSTESDTDSDTSSSHQEEGGGNVT